MKTLSTAVILFCVCGAIAGAQDAGSEVGLSGRPRFEWTSGNYFDVRMLEIAVSPVDVSLDVGLDYWSGYHHLSYPVGGRGDLYIGVAWGIISLLGELGYGWSIPGRSPQVNWEPHVTGFFGPVAGIRSNGNVVVGLRSAMKYQLTLKNGRTHLFAGFGATVAVDTGQQSVVISIPLETGVTISSRRTYR